MHMQDASSHLIGTSGTPTHSASATSPAATGSHMPGGGSLAERLQNTLWLQAQKIGSTAAGTFVTRPDPDSDSEIRLEPISNIRMDGACPFTQIKESDPFRGWAVMCYFLKDDMYRTFTEKRKDKTFFVTFVCEHQDKQQAAAMIHILPGHTVDTAARTIFQDLAVIAKQFGLDMLWD